MVDYIDGEVWRPVVGYEGIYDVSTHGRVRRVWDAKRGRWKAGRIMQARVNKLGYLYVGLYDGSHPNSKKLYVHVLVAAAHIGPKPAGKEVNHIDRDKSNNRVDNLEYKTHLENMNHSYRDRVLAIRAVAKVGIEAAEEIRTRYQNGERQYLLADEYGFSRAIVNRIVHMKAWRNELTPAAPTAPAEEE